MEVGRLSAVRVEHSALLVEHSDVRNGRADRFSGDQDVRAVKTDYGQNWHGLSSVAVQKVEKRWEARMPDWLGHDLEEVSVGTCCG